MKSDPKTMLEQIATSIENVMRKAQPLRPTKKRMTLGAFMTHALEQLQKAAQEEPAPAQRRLEALKRGVQDVAARVAKLNAEDLDSEKVTVDVETAFAPTGDRPIEGLTTASDQSTDEIALTSIEVSGSTTSNFAQNLQEVAKTLQKAMDDLAGKPKKPAKSESTARSAATKARNDGVAPEGWPLDLNSSAFRSGIAKDEDGPTWGYDPESVASSREE